MTRVEKAGTVGNGAIAEECSLTARERREQEESRTAGFLKLLASATTSRELIRQATEFIKHQTGCEQVVMRMRRRPGSGRGAELTPVQQPEELICSRDCFGLPSCEHDCPPECNCGGLVCGHCDLEQPWFTAAGSFRTNQRSATARLRFGTGLAGPLPVRCRLSELESIALIPLKLGSERVGLIQMGDRRGGLFSAEDIAGWELLGGQLAIAWARLESEQALRDHEAQTQALLNTIADAVVLNEFTADGQVGRFIDLNDAFCRMVGYSREELLNMSPHELDDPASGTSAADIAEEIAEKGSTAFDQVLIARDGKRVPVRIRICLFTLRGETKVIAAVTNLTEHFRIEQDLCASRLQLGTALQAARLGVWSRDLENDTFTADSLMRSFFGWSEEQVITSQTLFDSVDPEDRAQLHMQRASAGRSISLEYRVPQPDGSVRWLAVTGDRVFDDAGNPVRVVGVAQDITERKQAEQKVHELEQQVRHSQKLEAVGRLAGGVAHDFNNLLMVVRSYTEIIEDSLPPRDPLRRNTQAITTAADRAARLTSQMLAFSRKQVLCPVPLMLSHAVTESARMLRRLIGEDVELRVLCPDGWTVRADPDQVAQVLMNLCVNARDAMPQGGTLTLSTRNVSPSAAFLAEHAYMPVGDYVCLEVRDTGIGISREMQERIFEPFFTTKSVGKGTGLGLSTVYGIVKQSNGFITVESEPGQGACFSIYLPRIEDHAAAPSTGKAQWLQQGNETLLVVEDEEALRESIREFLCGLGYRVLTADCGAQALDVVQDFGGRIDVVIADLVMPKMGGRELSLELARRLPGLHTIYMSGYSEETELPMLVRASGDAFLQKPFSLASLARRVRELLDTRES